MSGLYDIFICHDQSSAVPVKRLTSSLASRGVSCIAFEAGPGTELQPRLAAAKVFLAWASENFFDSRNCQKHLALAYIATSQESAAAAHRIVLVNAESGVRHIYPLHLRKQVFSLAPGLEEAPDFQALAERLQQHCSRIVGTLGSLYPPMRSGWIEPFDTLSREPEHFYGRERELWDLHDSLNPPHGSETGEQPNPWVVISGAPGQGKSTLAREYAFRFGAAYPGGIFRLSADEARPVARMSELAQNYSLKPQLLGMLRHLKADARSTAGDGLEPIRAELMEAMQGIDKPFLWIVDNLPEDINGPVLRQWLAPEFKGATRPLGRNIVITRSHRYDQRAETIHLPTLDETSGRMLISGGRLPGRSEEIESLDWLLEGMGRHPRFAAMTSVLANGLRRSRRSVFSWLLHRFEKKNKQATECAHDLAGQLPVSNTLLCASVLLESLQSLQGPARDILRLAFELENQPIPLAFIAQCLHLSGLGPDDQKGDVFAIMLNEPQEIPLTLDAAMDYVRSGMADLAESALAECTDQSVMVYLPAARAFNRMAPSSPRQALLREAAVQVMYIMAESCCAADDWHDLASIAAHGRKLMADMRDRPIESEDSAAETTGRIRLALHLADLDLMFGARQRAITAYRAASVYLTRAMAIDPHNGSRQRDFARIQEQLGDLLNEQGEPDTALDHYRKSLGVRAYMAKQDTNNPDRHLDLLRLHIKIGQVQQSLLDLEAALQSQQSAHGLRLKLLNQKPQDSNLEFELGTSHAELAERHIALGNLQEAMKELLDALSIFEKLAEAQPGQVKFASAPMGVHNRIGDVLYAQDDLSGALNRYRTGLAIAENIVRLEPDNAERYFDLALCQNHLGDTLTGLDDVAEADIHFQAFLAISHGKAGKSAFEGIRRRNIAAVHIKLGRIRETDKDIDQALEHYEPALTIIKKLAIEIPDNSQLREDLHWLTKRIDRLKERRENEMRRMARATQPPQ